MAKKKRETIITPDFRVSYPALFEPKKNDMNGKMEYSVVALFPKDADLSKLKKAAAQAIKDKWGDKKLKGLKNPFRDQADRADEDTGEMPDGWVEGAIFMTYRTTVKPGIIDRKKEAILDAEGLYAGCWARASVSVYAFEHKNDKGVVMARGVGFGLNNIQFVKDDEPFSGRRKAEDEFEAIDDPEDESVDIDDGDDPFAD